MCERSYYEKKRNNNNIVPKKRNTDNEASVSLLENHRSVMIGTTNSGKTYCLLKILEEVYKNRHIHMIISDLPINSQIKQEVLKLNQQFFIKDQF